MLPLALMAALWTCAGLILGALLDFPYSSWLGLGVFGLQIAGGGWRFPETPPNSKRWRELRERFGPLGYSATTAVHCGQAPGCLWVTRGFLDAELEHAELLEGVRAQGWGWASRTLALPARLRTAAEKGRRYRLGGGPTALDYLLWLLGATASLLELPWRVARPAHLDLTLVAAAARARSQDPPAWLESYSWASPVSRAELRTLAAAAAAQGWRAGQEWPVTPRPTIPLRVWLPLSALTLGVVGAGLWGVFGLPFLTWGLTRLGLAFWLFPPGRAVSFSGTVVSGLDDLVSEPRPFLDDGQCRLELVGLTSPALGELAGAGWRQGDRLALAGRLGYLASGLAAALFGASMVGLWWTGV